MNAKQKLIKLKDAAKEARLDWEYDEGKVVINLYQDIDVRQVAQLQLVVSTRDSKDVQAFVRGVRMGKKKERYRSLHCRGKMLRAEIRSMAKMIGMKTRKANDLIKFLDSVTE